MKLIKLIAPAATIAVIAMFAPHAGAQTMGEYATTTAGVASGGTSMGNSIAASVNNSTDDIGGGSPTWGASSLGGSFADRAGAASGSGLGGDFEARAGSSSQASESRWPSTGFSSVGSADRFTESGDSDRFKDQDRFAEHTEFSSSTDRFPPGVLDQNRQGLDTHYSSSSGLDHGYSSSSGLDGSYTNN